MAGSVIKSGISYNKYIWHANENACDACQKLNGKEFLYEEDIPDRPHPNCLCWVEAVNGDEPCDCCSNIELIEEAYGDALALQDELNAEISNIYDFIIEYQDVMMGLLPYQITNLIEIVDNLRIIFQSIAIFINNFNLLMAAHDGSCDKYYHAKANCEATQLGITGEKTAKILSDAKELFDSSVRAVLYAVKTRSDIQETILNKVKDSAEDQETNREGREVGKKYPKGDCSEILKYKLPKDKQW